MRIKEIYGFLDSVAPFSGAAEWDNCGILIGDENAEVTKVLIALDVTESVIREASEMGAELVITHHPIIFSPIKSVLSQSLVYKAVKSGITFLAAHTCLDVAPGGVNDCLAEKTGVKNVKETKDIFLKIGQVEKTTVRDFARKVKTALGGGVSFTLPEKEIEKVAFCSGSGGDLVCLAADNGADALLTGEAKHHEYLLAKDLGLSLIVAGHYETENIICEYLKTKLKEKFGDALTVEVSSEKPPVNYIY